MVLKDNFPGHNSYVVSDFIRPFLRPYMDVIPNPNMAFIFRISCILALIFPILLKYCPKCERKGSFLKSQIKSLVVQTEARSCGYESFFTLLTLPTLHHLTSIFPTMKSFAKGKSFSNDESLISEVKAWLQHDMHNLLRST